MPLGTRVTGEKNLAFAGFCLDSPGDRSNNSGMGTGERKRAGGRPRKLKGRRKRNLNVRVTAEELQAIRAAGVAEGVPYSKWVRGAIHRALDDDVPREVNTPQSHYCPVYRALLANFAQVIQQIEAERRQSGGQARDIGESSG